VEDNQHGIVSAFLGMKAILDAGLRPRRSVGLAFVADEETGSLCGLDYLLRNHRDLFEKDSMIIVPDGGNEEGTMIEVAEKSMLWIKVTVTGQQCHASTPDKGRNSLYGAARLIVAFESLKARFNVEDTLFRPPQSTFEPTKIEANVPNINTIPGRDVFYLDCRILPGYPVENVIAFVKKKAEAIAVELDLDIQIETHYRQETKNPTSPEAAVVQALKGAIKKVTGLDARPMGIGGGTVAAFFREAGFPAAVWLTEPDTPHQPNEYTLISNIMNDAKVFATLFLREEEKSGS
jgi:succinyl-diaminopimelate desuccinylase